LTETISPQDLASVLHRPAETLSALLEATVARRPDAPAIHHQGQCLSWGEFLSLTRRAAAGLARHGLGWNDRLALWLPTLPEYLVLSFAAWRLGAVVVSVNTRFNSSELEHALRAQRPKLLAFWPNFAEIDFPRILAGVPAEALGSVRTVLLHGADATVPACLPDAHPVAIAALTDGPEMARDAATPDSPCVTFTTSGTTRAPKFVLHRQRGIAHHARDVAQALGFDAPDAVTFNPLPLCAVYGFTEALASIAGGAPQADPDAAARCGGGCFADGTASRDALHGNRRPVPAVAGRSAGAPRIPGAAQCRLRDLQPRQHRLSRRGGATWPAADRCVRHE